MRISDWSSDVCSSDLCTGGGEGCSAVAVAAGLAGRDRQHEIPDRTLEGAAVGMERQVEAEMPLREIGGELTRRLGQQGLFAAGGFRLPAPVQRSEESRVGKRWDRKCRTRWAEQH